MAARPPRRASAPPPMVGASRSRAHDGAVAVLDVAAGARAVSAAARGRCTGHGARSCRTTVRELVTRTGDRLRLWSLPSGARAAARPRLPTACRRLVALDRSSELLAVGLASGQLQLELGRRGGELDARPLAFFGHRGPITAAALNAGRSLAATGGSDGIVRVWDIASGAPTAAVMQPAEGRRDARRIERRWPLRRERRRARRSASPPWPMAACWQSCAPTAP